VFSSFNPTVQVPGETVPTSLLVPTEAGSGNFATQYPTSGTSPTRNAGDVFITLGSLPNGDGLGNLEDVYLSDGTASNSTNSDNANYIANNQPVGDETWSWAASGGTAGPLDLPIDVQGGSTSGVIDMTFRPIRNESNTTMTLRYVVQDGSGTHSYYTQFTGGSSDVTEVGATWNHNASVVDLSPAMNGGQPIPNEVAFTIPGTNTTSTDTLDDILDATSGTYASGAYDRLYLEPGTYTVDYSSTTNPALTIARPIQLDGSTSAILSFAANSTPPSPTQPETDYGDAIDIGSSHVTLSNFQIRFPNQVYFSSGTVIGAGPLSGNSLTNELVDVNFQNLNIQGPAQAEHYSNGYASPDGYGNDGLPEQSLIVCYGVSGTIENCTLRGGTTEFDGGPWDVIGNTYLGTVPTDLYYSSSYANAAYRNQVVPSNTYEILSSNSPHDQVIEDNTVSESRPAGTPSSSPLGFAYRFLFYGSGGDGGAAGGYNNLIQGNVAGNGVGRRLGSDLSPMTGNPVPYVQGEVYDNLADYPEFVLNENYRVDYEGVALSVGSSSSQVLSIPSPSVTFYRQPVAAGDVVAILNGQNAGFYDTITQVLDSSDFLMQNALPSGSYQIAICQGLVGSRYVGNQWNLSGTTSTGFDIQGNQFGPQITGNTITGDYTTVIDGDTHYLVNSAINVVAGYVDVASNSTDVGYVYPFPTPTEEWTHSVVFGAVVDDNTIDGTGTGITVGTNLGGNSDLGLTFLTAAITNNLFEGYAAITNPNSLAIPDFSSVLNVGYLTQNLTQTNNPTATTRTRTLGFAVINCVLPAIVPESVLPIC